MQKSRHAVAVFAGFGMLALAVGLCTGEAAPEGTRVELWPDGLPAGAAQLDPARVAELQKRSTEEWITYVGQPTLTVMQPEEGRRNGCAVIVCPGGGYNGLAWKKEGIEIAEWLNSLGVTAFVLQYRVPRRDPERPWFEPLQDAQRAIRYVRHEAKRWGIDPHRIGILGFSAGGHLSAMASMHYQKPAYEAQDAIDQESCRPDFTVLVYAAYLGDPNDQTRLSRLVHVDSNTPPAFMVVTWDDRWRGLHAGLLLAEYKKAGVLAECHVFARGGHGYGLRPSEHPVSRAWPRLCAAWMKELGLLGRLQGDKATAGE